MAMTALDASLPLPLSVTAAAAMPLPAAAAAPKAFDFSATLGLAALAFLAAGLLGTVGSHAILPSPGGDLDPLYGTRGALKDILAQVAVVGIIVALVVRGTRGWTVLDYLALGRPQLRHVVLSVGGITLFWVAIVLTWRFGGIEQSDSWMSATYQRAVAGHYLPLLWLSTALGAPVAEEILFRGFIYRGLSQTRLRALGAVLLTSATFAVIHQQYQVDGVAAIFLLGLLLGWLRKRTGSTIVPMFVHAIHNLGVTALAAALLA
jgi:uncharacterized protein